MIHVHDTTFSNSLIFDFFLNLEFVSKYRNDAGLVYMSAVWAMTDLVEVTFWVVQGSERFHYSPLCVIWLDNKFYSEERVSISKRYSKILVCGF